MLKTKNLFLSFLVIIIFILSIVIITKNVSAQWSPPPTHPGGGQPDSLIFNPLLEDIDGDGYSINDLGSLGIGVSNTGSSGLYSSSDNKRIAVKGEGEHGIVGIGTGGDIGDPSYGILGQVDGGTHAGYFEGLVYMEVDGDYNLGLKNINTDSEKSTELRFYNNDYSAIYYHDNTDQLRIWNDENIANFDDNGNIFVNRLAISTTTGGTDWSSIFNHGDVKLQVDGQTRIDLKDYSETNGRNALIFNLAEDSGGTGNNQYPEQQRHITILCNKEDPNTDNINSCDYFSFYSIDRPKFGEDYGGEQGRTTGIIASEFLSSSKWEDAYYLDPAFTGIGCTEDIDDPYNNGNCTATTSLKVKGFIKSDIYSGGGDQNVCVDDNGKFFVGSDCVDIGGSSLWSANGNDISYNNGNVGIGINNPVTKLDIRESGNFTPSTDYLAYIGSYANVNGNNGTGSGLLVQAGWYDNDTPIIAQFSALESGYAEVPRMTIKSNGDVIIKDHLLSDAWYGTSGVDGNGQNLWVGNSNDDIKIQGDLEFGNTEEEGDPKIYKSSNSLIIDIGN